MRRLQLNYSVRSKAKPRNESIRNRMKEYRKTGSHRTGESNTFNGLNSVKDMMCSRQHQKKYAGNFDDDLESWLETYKFYARIFELQPKDMGVAIPAMLNGEALASYNTIFQNDMQYRMISQHIWKAFMRSWDIK